MKIKVKSHVETEREIGYNNGLRKALSLLRKKRIEIERHRRNCEVWKKSFNPLGKYTVSDFCPKCAIGAISNIIEPLQFRLQYEKTKRGE
jgi:rRNA maturation protein Nop10